MGSKERGEIVIDTGDLRLVFQSLDSHLANQFGNCHFARYGQRLGVCGGKCLICQLLGSAQVRRLDQIRHDPALAGLPDLGGSNVSGQQGERPFAGHVEFTLQSRMNTAKERAQPRKAPGLLLGQIASAPHFQTDRGGCIVRQDRAQVAGADQVGNRSGIARIGFALSAGKALSGETRDAI